MVTRRIEKSKWHFFCDKISKIENLEEKHAQIEIAGIHLGDEMTAKWLQLFGISYSPRQDEVEIALKSLRHRIRHPSGIYVEEHANTLLSICVADRESVLHVVRLSSPLSFQLEPIG